MTLSKWIRLLEVVLWNSWLCNYFPSGYSFNIVDNTEEQCKIRNKQITDGDAKYDPDGEQMINNEGGNGLVTVNTFAMLQMANSSWL